MTRLEGKVILITGANGFIGSHMVTRLSKIARVKLLLLSRVERQSTQKNITWLKADLNQLTPDYWRSFGINSVNYIFHLGAFTPKTSAEANRIDPIISDNISGTRALLKSLPGTPEKLIFTSTLDVYAQPKNNEILSESSWINPSALYGSSKLFCESLASTWSAEVGCDCSILRYGHIYGPGEDQYGKLIPVVIRTLLAGQSPAIYGDGSALRDYLYVGDAVEASIRAALMKGSLGPVNIVRGESVMLKEIVQILISLVGNNIKMNLLPDKPNGNSLRFDNRLMSELLGSWSMTRLEDGLAAEVDAFRRTKNEH